MEYRTLGRTGVKASPLCLNRALDAGINFVNPADAGYDNPALRPEALRR